ncbi:MAG: flavin reductase family protein [Gammaproteobacteria bacterium]|nr:flavin reductase family protein [Gammaproteobacteria bacterium]
MTDRIEAVIDARDLRRAFGNFTTGVSIVTTLGVDGVPGGFTANSFTSVFIDPPLLLVSIAKSAYGCDTFTGQTGLRSTSWRMINAICPIASQVPVKTSLPTRDGGPK